MRAFLRRAFALAEYLFPQQPFLYQTKTRGLKLLVWLNEHPGRKILLTGRYQKPELSWMYQNVDPGDYCIDCGANIGYFTIHLTSLVGRDGLVSAFEPSTPNCAVIRLNAYINGLDSLELYNTCLTDPRRANQPFTEAEKNLPSNLQYYTLGTNTPEASMSTNTKISKTLDQFAAPPDKTFKLLKLDTEGSELRILKGAESTLRAPNSPLYILCEIDSDHLSRFGDNTQSLADFLAESGYEPLRCFTSSLPPREALNKKLSGNYLFAKRDIGHAR
ncbi:FkbM family methyltransferase [Halorhodospira halophila]|uniref:FkbM family methyltransferase n=1 Tax=Halorhodospira halophila TaxID=1053 RepID=UPI001913BCCA|nr:FkbM family methyltransferase [Halorhodospira halophila]MBK5944772.1 hypothetical protein [Halorhodospira halophila]